MGLAPLLLQVAGSVGQMNETSDETPLKPHENDLKVTTPHATHSDGNSQLSRHHRRQTPRARRIERNETLRRHHRLCDRAHLSQVRDIPLGADSPHYTDHGLEFRR